LTWILSEKWLWIIALAIILICTVPLVVVWVILNLPSEMRLFVTILIVIGWGVVAGYKDWIINKRKEEEKQA